MLSAHGCQIRNNIAAGFEVLMLPGNQPNPRLLSRVNEIPVSISIGISIPAMEIFVGSEGSCPLKPMLS